jgi:pimeloyl-ACP methyl ester carboxylesterase
MGPRPNVRELAPAIDGERRRWTSPAGGSGQVCCYVADGRPGRPVLLVHDLRVTSSAYEMRPLFECLRWRRPTFAPDLPGFGLSDRAELQYRPDLFAAVVAELLRRPRSPDLAVDAVTLGRGSEIVARVARDEPGLVRSLVMLEPSGLLPIRGGSLESLGARLGQLLGDRAARAVFAVLATRPLVRRALRARFHGAPDAGLVAHALASVQAPGAHRAPLVLAARGAGRSETVSLYRSLTVPVLVIHGARGGRATELEAFLHGGANRFAVRVWPTRGMPQFDRRADTIAALDRFWQSLPRAACDRAIR